jgi:hypothetical protein
MRQWGKDISLKMAVLKASLLSSVARDIASKPFRSNIYMIFHFLKGFLEFVTGLSYLREKVSVTE